MALKREAAAIGPSATGNVGPKRPKSGLEAVQSDAGLVQLQPNTHPVAREASRAVPLPDQAPGGTGCEDAEQKGAISTEQDPNPTKKTLLNRVASIGKSNLEQMMKALQKENERRKAAETKCAALQGQLHAAQGQLDAAQEQLDAMSQKNEALKAQLEAQKSVSRLKPGACWQFETDGGWEAFTPEGNEAMHQAYLDYLEENDDSRYVTITSGGVSRTVDFQLMQQTHLQTRKVRRIRLLPGVPPDWTTTAGDLLRQGTHLASFYVQVADQKIWDAVRRILQTSGHAWNKGMDCYCMSQAEIKSIHRIENIRLWHRYKARLAAMRQDHATYKITVGSAKLDLDGKGKTMAEAQEFLDCGERPVFDLDEKILLHGTSWDNADFIVREGFDHRTCQNGFYGAGVYFAAAACKSHQYTCDLHKNTRCTCKDERTLIIARVALGDSYIARATRLGERRAPIRSAASGVYDSIVVRPGPVQGHHNFEQVHQEYVIFDREQAYPSYVVQYTI
eukprot:s4761_g1.t1